MTSPNNDNTAVYDVGLRVSVRQLNSSGGYSGNGLDMSQELRVEAFTMLEVAQILTAFENARIQVLNDLAIRRGTQS